MATAARPTPKDKKRRRRRRAISLLVYAFIVFGIAWYFDSQATTTIIFVRHADTDTSAAAGNDPPLNARGIARANLLADFLMDVDVLASVDAIYASEFRRTQQTAAPLAKRLGLAVQIADQYDIEDFMKDVQREYKGKIVLVVTHEDILGELVAELHGHQSVPPIDATEYDNVYIVTIPLYGKVKTLRLRYGLGWDPTFGYASG